MLSLSVGAQLAAPSLSLLFSWTHTLNPALWSRPLLCFEKAPVLWSFRIKWFVSCPLTVSHGNLPKTSQTSQSLLSESSRLEFSAPPASQTQATNCNTPETPCAACHTWSCHPSTPTWLEPHTSARAGLKSSISSLPCRTLLPFHPLIPVPELPLQSDETLESALKCDPVPCFPAPSFLKNLHPSLGAIPRCLCNPKASQLYNYTQISNSSSLLPMLGVIKHMQDTFAWTETFSHEKTPFKEMGSSTANNPDMVPTALYPTHSLPDLTPEQLTIY